MESTNIVVDDFNDFENFSKKEEISSFTNEVIVEFGTIQDVATKAGSVATLAKIVARENVATTHD